MKPVLSNWDRLERLYTTVKKSKEWLHLNPAVNVVRGVGATHPRILFVAYSPTPQCHAGKKAYYHRINPTFVDIARELNVLPSECFFTTYMKIYRPGKQPTLQELDYARAVLEEEIRVLNPTAIVFADVQTAQSFLRLRGRNNLFGKTYRVAGIPAIVLTSVPNILRYSPSNRKYYLNEVERLKQVL